MELPGIAPLLRIGELRRRLAVSDHGLRAWESRHGLLQPARSPGALGQRSWGGRRHSMAAFTGGGVVIGRGAGLTHRIRLAFAGVVAGVTMEQGVVPFVAFARAAGWSSWARWGDAASARVTWRAAPGPRRR